VRGIPEPFFAIPGLPLSVIERIITSRRSIVRLIMKTQRILVAAVLGLLPGAPGHATAGNDPGSERCFCTIDVGSIHSEALGNSTHEIVGEFTDTDGNVHGYVVSTKDACTEDEDAFTQIDVPGAWLTRAIAVNANGAIAGAFFDDPTKPLYRYGFILRDGVFTTLDFPEPNPDLCDDPSHHRTSAFGINAQGQVVGAYRLCSEGDAFNHAFVWTDGVFTNIDVPDEFGANGSVAYSINDHGQIVGTYFTGVRIHGFFWSEGVYEKIDVALPDGTLASDTVPQGLNDAGEIVGSYVDADGKVRGFTLRNGIYTTEIDVPGSIATYFGTINAKGEIVGAYHTLEDDGSILVHGFSTVRCGKD
jgi:probable HAF family extracellular repeat protein